MNTLEEIKLTPLQISKAKYYLKMKNDPNYIANRRANNKTYYSKVKDLDEFKLKVSMKGKEYYNKIKIIKNKNADLLPDILE